MARMSTRPLLLPLGIAVLFLGCQRPQPEASAPPPAQPSAVAVKVARGKQLVESGGCHDCHSPKVFGPEGPVPDAARALTGHPQDEDLPEPPVHDGPWAVHANASGTAWSGPWGVVFASNLTPDSETGFGNYTEDAFLQAMRTGKRFGSGRPILPPMPWPAIAHYSDDDLRAIYAYLHSLPPTRNRVPDPVIAAPPPPPTAPPPPPPPPER